SLADAQLLPRRLLGIEDQRIIKLARPQSSIWLIPPVGERFAGQRETCFAKNVQHRRARESNQYDFPIPSRDTFRNRFGKRAVPHRLVVQRAMRLVMDDARSASGL